MKSSNSEKPRFLIGESVDGKLKHSDARIGFPVAHLEDHPDNAGNLFLNN